MRTHSSDPFLAGSDYPMSRERCRLRQERGVTLVVSLLFLLLLTILGVTSMTTGTLQERMAGNMRDIDIGLQGAEASLRYGEEWFAQSFFASKPTPLNNLNGVWAPGLIMPAEVDDPSWWTTNGISYMNDGSQQIQEAYEDPRHVVEDLNEFVPDDLMLGKPQTGVRYYRVTARGVGATGMSQTVLQSYFRVRW